MFYIPPVEKLSKLGFDTSLFPYKPCTRYKSRWGRGDEEQQIEIHKYDRQFTLVSLPMFDIECKFRFRVRNEHEFDKLLWQVGYTDDFPDGQQGYLDNISSSKYYYPDDAVFESLGLKKSTTGFGQGVISWVRCSDDQYVEYCIMNDDIAVDYDLIEFSIADDTPADFDHIKNCKSAQELIEAVLNDTNHTIYKSGHFHFRVLTEDDFLVLCWQLGFTEKEPPYLQ